MRTSNHRNENSLRFRKIDHQRTGPTQRQRRVAEIIRHALAEILARKNLRDPFLNSLRLTITEVNIGSDLRTAIVYVLFPKDSMVKETLEKLKHAKNEMRMQLSAGIALKFVPDLQFKYDTSLDYVEKINHLLLSPRVRQDTQI